MRTKKPFHELNFCDAFMFTAAMEEPEFSRDVLESYRNEPDITKAR